MFVLWELVDQVTCIFSVGLPIGPLPAHARVWSSTLVPTHELLSHDVVPFLGTYDIQLDIYRKASASLWAPALVYTMIGAHWAGSCSASRALRTRRRS